MQKTLLLLSTFMVILFFTACKDDETTPIDDNPDPVTYNLSAKINGTLFQTDGVYFKLNNPRVHHNMTCNYTDANNISTSFSISFYGDTLGTYIFKDGSDAEAEATYSNGTAPNIISYTATSGTITVTKIDVAAQKISGTFNFSAKDANGNIKTITEGKFTDVPKL